MRNTSSVDECIHLLMDADLTDEQRKELEAWLRAGPESDSLKRAETISRFLKEIAEETPAFDQPDYVWSRVKALIAEEENLLHRWPDRLWRMWTMPRLAWATSGFMVVLMGLVMWWPRMPEPGNFAQISNHQKPSQFGEIWQVYSFKPEVTASTYDSRAGDATIIWLSGIDEPHSRFGEIWQVYSFKPEVTATAYNSYLGDATIIWLSGMDYEESPEKRVVSL